MAEISLHGLCGLCRLPLFKSYHLFIFLDMWLISGTDLFAGFLFVGKKCRNGNEHGNYIATIGNMRGFHSPRTTGKVLRAQQGDVVFMILPIAQAGKLDSVG